MHCELIQDKEAPEGGTGEPLGFLQKVALLQPQPRLCSASGVAQKPRAGSSRWAALGKCSKRGSRQGPGSQGGLLECAPCKGEGRALFWEYRTAQDPGGKMGLRGVSFSFQPCW